MSSIDYNLFWREHYADYESHPTYVYRKRTLLRILKNLHLSRGSLLFDLGCGAGGFLAAVRREYDADTLQLAGCDVSQEAIQVARKRVPKGRFFDTSPPELDEPVDLFVCSEVLEHIETPMPLVQWMADMLRTDGHLLLTLPSGKLTKADAYFGHLRHYEPDDVRAMLESVGLEVKWIKRRGFPFVSLQKYLMSLAVGKVANQFVNCKPSWYKKAILSFASALFRLHDFIPAGPQLFALAVKPASEKMSD